MPSGSASLGELLERSNHELRPTTTTTTTKNYAQQHRRGCHIPPSNIALPSLLSASGLSSQKAQSLRISHKKVPAVALLASGCTQERKALQHTDNQCVLGFSIREQFSEVSKSHIWSDQSSCLAQKEEGLRPRRRTPLQHVPHSNQCRHPQSSPLWKMG